MAKLHTGPEHSVIQPTQTRRLRTDLFCNCFWRGDSRSFQCHIYLYRASQSQDLDRAAGDIGPTCFLSMSKIYANDHDTCKEVPYRLWRRAALLEQTRCVQQPNWLGVLWLICYRRQTDLHLKPDCANWISFVVVYRRPRILSTAQFTCDSLLVNQ